MLCPKFSWPLLIFALAPLTADALGYPKSPTLVFPASHSFAGQPMDTSLQRPPILGRAEFIEAEYGLNQASFSTTAIVYVSSGIAHEYYIALLPLDEHQRLAIERVDLLYEDFMQTPLPPPLRRLLHLSAVVHAGPGKWFEFIPINRDGPLRRYRSQYLVASMNGVRPYGKAFSPIDATFNYQASYNLGTFEAFLLGSRRPTELREFFSGAPNRALEAIKNEWKATQRGPVYFQNSTLSPRAATRALEQFLDYSLVHQVWGKPYRLVGHTCVTSILSALRLSGHPVSVSWGPLAWLGNHIPTLTPLTVSSQNFASTNRLEPIENYPGFHEGLKRILENHVPGVHYGRAEGPLVE